MRSARLALILLVAALALPAAEVAGRWTGVIEIPGGTYNLQVVFESKDGAIQGYAEVEGGQYPFQKVKLDGDKLTFEASADGDVYSFDCAIEGNKLTGNIKITNGGTGKIGLTRVP